MQYVVCVCVCDGLPIQLVSSARCLFVFDVSSEIENTKKKGGEKKKSIERASIGKESGKEPVKVEKFD